MRHTRVIVAHYGGPAALRVVEEECPEPKDGEVRVRVLAAGVSLPAKVTWCQTHLWHSRKALRPGGRVVGYGLTTSLRGEGLTSSRPGRRQRFRGTAVCGLYIVGGWLLLGRKRLAPYSIQTLKRLRPTLFRQDLIALLDLLKQEKIKPLVAQRFPLAEARQAHELLGKGGVTGKIVLTPDG